MERACPARIRFDEGPRKRAGLVSGGVSWREMTRASSPHRCTETQVIHPRPTNGSDVDMRLNPRASSADSSKNPDRHCALRTATAPESCYPMVFYAGTAT